MTEFVVDNKPCPYLDNKMANTQYKMIPYCSKEQCQSFIDHGWRRFGKLFFRPQCVGCDECKSMRIRLNAFRFSKSQKRVLKKNSETKVIICKPTLSQEHLNMYDRYHAYMRDKKGWETESINSQDYYHSFVDGHHDYGLEFLYVIGGELAGVALVDHLEDGLSSIYCYYDHKYREYSIGTFSILKQIEYAKKMELAYIYLGYWVKENESLSYKSKYAPYEILDGSFEIEEETRWV
jgi:leucyl-tRNA---protein transferase